MRNKPLLQRKLQHLACTAAVSALAMAGLTLAGTKPVLAEFEIQEAEIEKGEIEIEYRGAYHWGVPQVTDENENANDLVQSNELELEMGISDWWMISVTSGFDKALGEDLQATAVEVETQFGLVRREGNGLGLAFQMGYEKAINNHKHLDEAEPNEFGFGPIVEFAVGNCSPGSSAPTPIRKASASNMAGAANTTSPSAGASASRCSARSRIWRTPDPSTTRSTA